MMHHCDGSDVSTTREIPDTQFDPGAMTVSQAAGPRLPGFTVIQCECGLSFDDRTRLVSFPHPFYGQGTLP